MQVKKVMERMGNIIFTNQFIYFIALVLAYVIGILVSCVLFNESLTISKIIGAFFIITGVTIFSSFN